MIKYNYKKAGALYDRMFDILADMPDILARDTRQYERRAFMRTITRGGDMSQYIDDIADYIIECATDAERIELEKLSLEIVLFTKKK